MQIHNLKKNKSNRKSIKVGRGGKRGKTSGRGTKGQNARAGRKKRPEMRDFIKKIPKLRGRGRNSFKSRFDPFIAVNLSLVESKFNKGEVVNPNTLLEKGIIQKKNGKIGRVKILASGALTKALNFEKVEISDTARKILESVGGKFVESKNKLNE